MEPLPMEAPQVNSDTRTDDQLLQVMRTSYKLAAVSHFVGLYSHHLDFKHQVHVSQHTLLYTTRWLKESQEWEGRRNE